MRFQALITLLIATFPAQAAEFKHVGDFLLQAHFKLVGQQVTPIPMKPIAFRVFTDGVQIRVSAEDDEDSHATFEIYRSDGIGRQRQGAGALEVIPGLQAMSNVSGTLRHLRLCSESMTITTFPGVSDQTIVSHSIAAEPTQPDKSAVPNLPPTP
ncbi:MAG: hypothetical protein WEB53_05475 [Akkermansiaceae bacterium]